MGLKEREEAFRRKERSQSHFPEQNQRDITHPRAGDRHPGTRVHTYAQRRLGNISIQLKKFFLTSPCIKKKQKVGLPLWLSCKESACKCWRPRFDPWVGKIPWRRKRLPTPVFWPGESHVYIVHGVTKSQTRLDDSLFHFSCVK